MFEWDSLQVWSSVHRRSISTTIRPRYFVKWSLGIPVTDGRIRIEVKERAPRVDLTKRRLALPFYLLSRIARANCSAARPKRNVALRKALSCSLLKRPASDG